MAVAARHGVIGPTQPAGAHVMHTAIPYREVQGKPCNENREPAMRTGLPCNESRYFPVGIDLQGFPVSCTGFGFAV